jgi:non-specific protein-tyrosine kinase
MVGQIIHQANPTGQDFYTIERLAESYAQIAVRQPILQAVIDSLGLEMSWQGLSGRVHAAPIQRTQLLAITVRDTSPKRAVVIADEIAHQLIEQSPSSPDNQARQERSQFVQSQLDDLEERIEAAQARVKDLEAELETAFSARQIQDLQTEIASLESLVNNWQVNYSELLAFLEGTNVPNYLTIIEPAQTPGTPVSPNVRTNVLLAAAVGFVLAAGAALLLEYIDDTVKSTEDVSTSLGLTVLGGINRMKGKDYEGKLIITQAPFSAAAEAYRLVRTNIQFATVDQPAKSILVTSPNPGEGKSVTAVNLGTSMAQAGLRTIVVDADVRIPSLHQLLQIPNLSGLTDLLRRSGLEIDDILNDVGIENLKVITSGPLPPNPSEMLGSQRMVELIHRLEDMADVIIFDTAPVLAVSDPVVLSSRVNGVVLVIRAGRTRRDATRHAVGRLRQVEANLLGVVLNRISGRDASYHYYYSHYTRSSTTSLSEQAGKRASTPGDGTPGASAPVRDAPVLKA